MKRFMISLLLLALGGCSSTTIINNLKEEYAVNPTPALKAEIEALEKQQEIDEYNEQVDRENWALCDSMYRRAGVATYHVGHSHSKALSGRIRHSWVISDLNTNDCRQVLRDYWAEHWRE